MKTKLFCTLACLASALALRADPVITFDDLPSSLAPVPAGYHLLSWSGLTNIDSSTFPGNPSGYQAADVSPLNVISGGGADTGTMAGGVFDLLSAYVTAAFNDNLQFEAKGYIEDTLAYDQTFALSATAPTLVSFNFYGVDRVDFTAAGGTHHAGYSGTGAYFALDNVSVTTYVPFVPPLITNGGFETGDFSDWGIFGDTNYCSVVSNPSFVHSGSYGASLGPTVLGYLQQRIQPTQIGVSYSVSYWLENSLAGVNSFTNYWGGYSVFSFVDGPAFAWTNIQMNLLAGQPEESLEYSFLNASYYFGLDDVIVTPAVLVSNGGFETGDFSGWTPSGNSGKDVVTAAARRAGTFGADFAASGSLGFISQFVPTFPGQAYLVSLWLDSPDGQTPNRFECSWNGQTVINRANMGAFGWTNLHFTASSPLTNTSLEIGGRDDPSALGLDEVSVVPVPLLQNGGFEFGDFTGWTTNGNATFFSVSSSFAEAGFYGGQFGPETNLGYLSQTVATIPGQAYVIGFMLYNYSTLTNRQFTVSWNNTSLMNVTNIGLIGWLPYQFLVRAAGASSTLTFGFRNDPAFFGLDQVFVSPVAPPSFTSVVKTNNRVDLTINFMPSYYYSVEYSTNLTKTNWTVLQAAIIPPTTPMKVTDTAPPDPYRFYRVQMYPPPLIF